MVHDSFYLYVCWKLWLQIPITTPVCHEGSPAFTSIAARGYKNDVRKVQAVANTTIWASLSHVAQELDTERTCFEYGTIVTCNDSDEGQVLYFVESKQ
jgi:hypothetical protein